MKNCHTKNVTHGQTDRETDRETERQTYTLTDRQTHRQTTHTHRRKAGSIQLLAAAKIFKKVDCKSPKDDVTWLRLSKSMRFFKVKQDDNNRFDLIHGQKAMNIQTDKDKKHT